MRLMSEYNPEIVNLLFAVLYNAYIYASASNNDFQMISSLEGLSEC